jgi:hypothetical protein
VQITLDEHGGRTRAGIGLTNVGPTPIHARAVEAFRYRRSMTERSRKSRSRGGRRELTEDRRGNARTSDVVRVHGPGAPHCGAAHAVDMPSTNGRS